MWHRPFTQIQKKFWEHKQWITAESIGLLAVAGLIYYLAPAWGISLLISWLIFAWILGYRAYKGKYGFSRRGYTLIILFCLILPISAGFILNTKIDNPNKPEFSETSSISIDTSSDQKTANISLEFKNGAGKQTAYNFVSNIIAFPANSPSSIYYDRCPNTNAIPPDSSVSLIPHLSQMQSVQNEVWLVYCEINYSDGNFWWSKEYHDMPYWWVYSYNLNSLLNMNPGIKKICEPIVNQFLSKLSDDERYNAQWEEKK
jgi:hypothetical protein